MPEFEEIKKVADEQGHPDPMDEGGDFAEEHTGAGDAVAPDKA